MDHDLTLYAVSVIFAGAALLGGVALFARQSLLVAYIVLGVALGPWGLAIVSDSSTIRSIGQVGIIFLLFLLGLNLHPQKLLRMLREATFVTLVSSLLFALIGVVMMLPFGFTWVECLFIGAMMMFSSTILGLKLLPTTALHHRHIGEVIISVLLLQDVIAILVLASLDAWSDPQGGYSRVLSLLVYIPGLALSAFALERYVLHPLIRRFDTIQEYIFLVSIGWCVGLAELAHGLGFSREMGAFIAGVALASSPISTFIAESLKPLRDFFLILFFFTLGASFELPQLRHVLVPALVLGVGMLLIKPWVIRLLLVRAGEPVAVSQEIGVRLGQLSEFSLLIAVLALSSGVIAERASYVIQAATLISFILSSYLIMLRFATPIALDPKLRRD